VRHEAEDGVKPKRFLILVALVGFVLRPSALTAKQMAGGQMPDPKAMSGIPLQVPDVPVGTVTARVIRGALTNPLSGQTVELTAAGGAPKTAQTDASGRATFSGIAPGTRVKAAVVVDGERVESQEFAVPAAGGMRVMLVATDAALEKKAAADRQLAAGPAVSGAVVFGDQSRVVIEVGDDALNVFNILQIVNTAKRPVTIGDPLVFDLPAGAAGAGMLEGSAPNAVAAGNRVTITGPFAPGNTLVQFGYSVPLGSGEITLAQRLPAPMIQVSVLAQKVGAMQLSSPQIGERREMGADGQNYIVAQGGAMKAGDTLTLTLTGLPHRATWPRNLALLVSAVILGAGAWGATRGTVGSPQAARRGQLNARRDKLFTELAGLENERRKGTVDPARYAARRADLVTSLEDLYVELE
jgi:hypothetical protein